MKENGYLAVVVPDGILTNSSSQYVRDSIEENFRIVAIVSLPQTAFTNTGAGVKSSVLFLKKHAARTTEKIRRLKRGLQDDLAAAANLLKTYETYEREKKDALKQLKTPPAENAEENATENAPLTKEKISEQFSEKTTALREGLEEKYQTAKQENLPDYPILMAIAENIGYDAAGKPNFKIVSRTENAEADGATLITEVRQNDLFTIEITRRRELKDGKDVETTVSETVLPDAGITGELRKFIEAIENGNDDFFASALS